MLMKKRTRVAIYECLFKEGVMVAKKDFHEPKHPDVPDVTNLEVIKALQSLKARSYVTEQFSWRHYYWYLTNEGTRYLRDFLHLPPEIVPATLKRQIRSDAVKPRAPLPRAEGSKPAEDRQSYRRAPGVGPDKKADVGAGTGEMEFRGGFGRGQRLPPQ